MEIYRDETKTVSLRVPAGTTNAHAKVFRDAVQLTEQSFNNVDAADPIVINLPYKAIRHNGRVEVVVTLTVDGETFDKKYYLDVVTPLLSLDEVALIAPGMDAKAVERSVRVIIEAFTGQSFGYEVSVKPFQGFGDSSLPLAYRLITLKGIQTAGVDINYNDFSVTGDGWYLDAQGPEWLEIKQAPPEELWPVVVNGPIRVPSWYRGKFVDNQYYLINGEWGYVSVPEDIQEAARLLVNDYACNQSSYRDRYLDIIKSSDWTLQYNPQAWSGTGNARADLILSQYKRPTMVVV